MLPFSAAKVLCGVPPGGKTAAERPVQVEAAAAAGAVQRFAHKVQPRTALELEGRFHLGQSKPAAGGLRLPPAAGGSPSNRQCLATWARGCICLTERLLGILAASQRA